MKRNATNRNDSDAACDSPPQLTEFLGIPLDEATKAQVIRLARKEKRKPAQMGRILLQEAIDARNAVPA